MSEPEEIKKQRIAQLASRELGIIPIGDFVNENEFYGNVKKALLNGLNEGLYYYMDDITKEKFLSIPHIGTKSWGFLMMIIRDALLVGKYPEHRDALDKYFSTQYGHSIFKIG